MWPRWFPKSPASHIASNVSSSKTHMHIVRCAVHSKPTGWSKLIESERHRLIHVKHLDRTFNHSIRNLYVEGTFCVPVQCAWSFLHYTQILVYICTYINIWQRIAFHADVWIHIRITRTSCSTAHTMQKPFTNCMCTLTPFVSNMYLLHIYSYIYIYIYL